MFEMRPYTHRGYRAGYDPFREIENLERCFFGSPAGSCEPHRRSSFRTDVTDEGESFLIKADLPGVEKGDISIDINGDTMVIKAERRSEHQEEDKKSKYIRCERTYGSFTRSFDISAVNADAIKAAFENGVLTVELPKKESEVTASRHLQID